MVSLNLEQVGSLPAGEAALLAWFPAFKRAVVGLSTRPDPVNYSFEPIRNVTETRANDERQNLLFIVSGELSNNIFTADGATAFQASYNFEDVSQVVQQFGFGSPDGAYFAYIGGPDVVATSTTQWTSRYTIGQPIGPPITREVITFVKSNQLAAVSDYQQRAPDAFPGALHLVDVRTGQHIFVHNAEAHAIQSVGTELTYQYDTDARQPTFRLDVTVVAGNVVSSVNSDNLFIAFGSGSQPIPALDSMPKAPTFIGNVPSVLRTNEGAGFSFRFGYVGDTQTRWSLDYSIERSDGLIVKDLEVNDIRSGQNFGGATRVVLWAPDDQVFEGDFSAQLTIKGQYWSAASPDKKYDYSYTRDILVKDDETGCFVDLNGDGRKEKIEGDFGQLLAKQSKLIDLLADYRNNMSENRSFVLERLEASRVADKAAFLNSVLAVKDALTALPAIKNHPIIFWSSQLEELIKISKEIAGKESISDQLDTAERLLYLKSAKEIAILLAKDIKAHLPGGLNPSLDLLTDPKKYFSLYKAFNRLDDLRAALSIEVENTQEIARIQNEITKTEIIVSRLEDTLNQLRACNETIASAPTTDGLTGANGSPAPILSPSAAAFAPVALGVGAGLDDVSPEPGFALFSVDIPNGTADLRSASRAGAFAVSGSSGNEVFEATLGAGFIFGGIGRDSVRLYGAEADAPLLSREEIVVLPFENRELMAFDQSGAYLALNDIEEIELSNGKLIFDLPAGDHSAIYRLYRAAFARVPDEEGLRYWIDVSSQFGLKPAALSESFQTSTEFLERYGGALDNANFVERMYGNVLGRAPDEGGKLFWVGHLNSGNIGRNDLLMLFSDSEENVMATLSDTLFGYYVI